MQEQDLATMAHDASKNAPPMGISPVEEAPITAEPHDPIHLDCDIVVLGGGGAGLVAAARISETTDKKVIVVEKRRNFGGGAMGAADWRVYGSRWQKDHGIPDNTLSALRQVMDETYWELNPALAYNTFRATGEFFDFLCDTGEGVEDLYKEGTYIFDGPDGPKIPAFKKERQGGAYVMKRMIALCEKNSVTMLKNTAVTDIDHQNGTYTVTAKDPGGESTITAKACILATGSWIRNHALVAKYVPKIAAMPMGNGGHTHPSYTGDAVALAEKLGAYIDYDSFEIRLMGPLGMCPSQTLMSMAAEPSTLWVNKDGKRWINESTQKRRGIFETGNRLAEQPDYQSFYLFDQEMIESCIKAYQNGKRQPWCFPAPPSYSEDWQADIENAFSPKKPGGMPPMPGMGKSIARADTLEALAEQMGVNTENLKATVAHYNEMCKNGMDTEYFKDPSEMIPFTGGPYYMVSGGLGTDGAFGGVLVNEEIQATAKDGGLIDGLYVPGDFSSGRFLNIRNNKVQITNDLSWAFASGWIAGGSAVAYLDKK